MKYVQVKFSEYGKTYTYKTNLSMLIGAVYDITADYETTYTSPVTVIGISNKRPEDVRPKDVPYIREITEARIITGCPRPDDSIHKVVFNEAKRTTVVVWDDGSHTSVKCSPNDTFDREKGLALCYMKRFFDNRSCFNETLKKYCKEDK